MKKLALTAIAASVMTANVAFAEADVYGKVNLSLNKIDAETNSTDTQDNIELVSHASRLGFKGDAAVTEGLKALAKIEYEVAADGDLFGANTENVFKARNVYVGVKGDAWG